MNPEIVGEELELLEQVADLLDNLPEQQTPSEKPIVEELRRLREQIISRRESKDVVSLNEQWHRLNSLLLQLRTSREAPKVDPRSPYFGHLRLQENGQVRDLCLGRATCIERGIRIVDWRNAPISRLFYRYDQGEDYEEEIAGHLRVGEILARRTLAIRDGVLERIEAPEGTFAVRADDDGRWERLDTGPARLAGGEGSALRAHRVGAASGRRLGTDLRGVFQRADKRLPEITSLIDSSQFELITRPRSGFVAIRGAAGSGKTTVALHRIAYLAFDDPEIDSERTLFIVFSPGLRNYVGHVLPSLGVEKVAIRTYHDWAAHQRKRHFPDLPKEQRLVSPATVQRMKLHPALAVALAEQVSRVEGRRNADQALDDWASVLTQRPLLEEVFGKHASGDVRTSEIATFIDWNRRQLDELFEWMGGDEGADAALEPEDDALLLRAWQLRVGPLGGHKPIRYRHIAIDEVQDFSPVEVQVMLGCLDDNRSLTLAGDTQQNLMEQSGFTSWGDFLAELGIPGTEVETLRVSYRSSREVIDFALGVLGDLREDEDPPEAPRSGPPVEVFRFTDRGACVAFLADALRRLAAEEPLASVAVLTADEALSEVYHEGLVASDVPRVRRVVDQEFTFAPGIEVTEIEQVKGLEFDYVIVVDVTDEHFPDSSSARRKLHVAATRAIHQLWLTCVGTPSAIIRNSAP